MDGEVFVALGLEQTDELRLQRGLALVAVGALALGGVLGHHGALVGGGNEVVGHDSRPQFREGEQLVPVVFVLLLPGGDLGGQAGGQVVAEGVEAVEDRDDAGLFFEGWDGNDKIL